MKKMEKENIKFYLSMLLGATPVIIMYVLESKYNINVRGYIDEIPNIYFTIALITLLLYIIFNYLSNNKKDNNDVLFLASQNDYQRMDASVGTTTILTIGLCAFIYFIKIPSLNISLFILIIYTSLIKGSFLDKTVVFKLEKGILNYKNNKEKRKFPVEKIKELKIAPNEIKLLYQESEKLISFLEIKEKDYKEIKFWFQKRLPNVIISKSKAS